MFLEDYDMMRLDARNVINCSLMPIKEIWYGDNENIIR